MIASSTNITNGVPANETKVLNETVPSGSKIITLNTANNKIALTSPESRILDLHHLKTEVERFSWDADNDFEMVLDGETSDGKNLSGKSIRIRPNALFFSRFIEGLEKFNTKLSISDANDALEALQRTTTEIPSDSIHMSSYQGILKFQYIIACATSQLIHIF